MALELETVPMIEVRTRNYGVGSVEGLRTVEPYEFEGLVAKEMPRDSLGKPYKDIHSHSMVLADQAALWNMYLLSRLGRVKLPQDVAEVLSYLFERKGHGNVTDDLCDYDNGKAGLTKAKPTDRSVKWIQRPVGDREEHYILVPAPGYVELTNDGAYNPETGTPFSTDTRAKAEKSWTNRGFSPTFAKLAVSYFYSRKEGEGTAAVYRWYNLDDYGRFDISASRDPGSRYCDVCAFPASRLSSGARRDSESGIVAVSEDEYNALLSVKQMKNLLGM